MSIPPPLVIKLGSSLVANARTLRLRHAFLHGLVSDLAELHEQGQPAVLVSSGAVALGYRALGGRPKSAGLVDTQAAAAVGQPLLMQGYRNIALEFGLDIAQVLLTYDDIGNSGRRQNCSNTIDRLLARGLLPVINENDSVATDELTVGDNDRLAAEVARLVGADRLIILTSVAGLYDRLPSESGAQLIEHVADVAPYLSLANGKSEIGRGGMRTKLEAGAMAQGAGIETLIAEGITDRPILSLLAGRRSTRIPATPVSQT